MGTRIAYCEAAFNDTIFRREIVETDFSEVLDRIQELYHETAVIL